MGNFTQWPQNIVVTCDYVTTQNHVWFGDLGGEGEWEEEIQGPIFFPGISKGYKKKIN